MLEDGTDRGFQNVGKLQSDAGEIPKRIHTILNNVHQHNCFIIRGSYIGYMF